MIFLIKKCKICNNEFQPKNPKKDYCSDECRTIADKQQKKQSKQNKAFGRNRDKVLERDGYKCSICNSIDRLHVHHKDRSGSTKTPNNEMDNLITLCNSCHMLIHGKDKKDHSGRKNYIPCIVCGALFEKEHDKKCCSPKCGNIHRSQQSKVKLICEFCSKEFEVRKSDIKPGKNKYCSMECRQNSQKKRITCTCLTCNKEFEEIPARIAAGKGKYCSRNCYAKAQKGTNQYTKKATV